MDAQRLTHQTLAVSYCGLHQKQIFPLLSSADRKIRIVFLLSLGLFVMGMATARCILSIGTSVQVALASVWAQREAVSSNSCLQSALKYSNRSRQIVSIFAVNAPVINGLFRAETWATRKHTSDYSSKNSRTYPNPLHKKKKSGFEIYKMTDFETKMSDMETTRAESIVELVTDPPVALPVSQWRCSVEAASQKGHSRRAG